MGAEYTVTRQAQWSNNGQLVVEISAGGFDYCNPDAFSRYYPGECETYLGLVPAVEAAIKIAERWKADEANKKDPQKIYIGVGATLGFTMPFDGMTACKTNYKKLLKQAKEHDAKLPKCPECGDILPDDERKRFGNEYTVDIDNEYPFCSEHCAERDYEFHEREQLQLRIDSLTREQCVELLENVSIQCYDHESLETLQEAVLVNVKDGTIEYMDLP